MDVLLRFKRPGDTDWSSPVALSAPDGRTLADPHLAPATPLPESVRATLEGRLAAGCPPEGFGDQWEEFSVSGTTYAFTTITPQLRLRS